MHVARIKIVSVEKEQRALHYYNNTRHLHKKINFCTFHKNIFFTTFLFPIMAFRHYTFSRYKHLTALRRVRLQNCNVRKV